jgi:ABC-type Zn uptake system ZnuABC Zn-binding protein ZnuA
LPSLATPPATCRAHAVAVIVLLALMFGHQARADMTVVVTTPDLKSITEAVSGGTVAVQSLISPGSDPEAFEPRPNHLVALRDAALVIRIGAGYEHWLDRLLQQAGKTHLLPGGQGYLDVSSQIALLEVRGRSVSTVPGHAHGSANPHYWLDPINAIAMSGQIAAALVRLMPQQRSAIEKAHARFVTDLKQRLDRWAQLLEAHRGAPLISYHATWPYFARRFRLNIVDVVEQKEGVPPSIARLAGLAKTMRAQKVRAILHEPFQPIDASRALADRTGAQVIVLAPSVGSLPDTGDYLKLIDYNVGLLAKTLASAP